MGLIVIDNSALLPLFLSDEDSGYARQVVSQSAAGDQLITLSLCLLEFGNGILKAVRQNRLSEAEASFAHHSLFLLPIGFQEFINGATITTVHGVAQRRNLTFYDAAYLAFAMSEGAKIATLDRALISAAQAEGVAVV